MSISDLSSLRSRFNNEHFYGSVAANKGANLCDSNLATGHQWVTIMVDANGHQEGRSNDNVEGNMYVL